MPDTSASFNINNLPEKEWRNTNIPSSWQAEFADLRDYQGVGWYKKEFNYDNNAKNIFIKFEAVDYKADVYINNKLVGTHEGGYTPFELNINQYVKNGNNTIIVRVMDPPYNEIGMEGISYLHIPHGKQSWYVQASGIWRDVELVTKHEIFIKKLFLTPSIDGSIKLDAYLTSDYKGKASLKIFSPKGNEVLNKDLDVNNQNIISLDEKINEPELWDIDSPNLYKAELILDEDTLTERFGFRKIEVKDKRIYLNDRPLFIIGALDQDFYPESIYTTPSEEYIRDEMIKAKELGLNMLRCHIKVPDNRYMKVADEVGMLVWYEIPNWETFTKEAAARGSITFDEMLERDWNHPSLVILSIINESWGIDLSKPEQREWLTKEYERTKAKAIGRLIVDNSACWGNFHMQTDINDYHTYYSIPENRLKFDQTINDVSTRPKWLFSENGDSKETHNEALMISEFGNWGLPKLPSKLPWWFERQFYEDYITLPKGHTERFNEFKLNRIFKNYDDLAEESQKAQFNSLKYEIESIRINKEFSGYIITEFTDINWESNGLLDMWRNKKIYADDLNNIQQQVVIIPRPEKYNYYEGEKININLYISYYSNEQNNYELKWNSGNSNGMMSIQIMSSTDVLKLQPLEIQSNGREGKVRISFELIDNDKVVAKNFTEVFIYPKISEEKNDGVKIVNSLNDKLLKEIKSGKSVICIVDSTTKIPSEFPFKIKSRNEEWYDGNWASNFNWLLPEHPVFKDISFGKSLGFEIAHSSPQFVLTELPSKYFNDVLSGMYIGWVHLHSAYIYQIKYGKGNLIYCTFPINNDEPFAKHLKKNLVNYIKSNDYKPLSTLN